jgi:putative membrane protein
MALTAADHARVSDAITSAERTTSGEIFCVVAEACDDYRVVPFAWAGLVALVVPPLLLWFGLGYPGLLAGGWDARVPDPQAVVVLYAGLSAAFFVAAFVAVRLRPVRLALTPRSLKREAVHRAAVASFLAHGIHVTDARTGVLIFLATAEHVAEVVADEGIYKRVDPAIWGDAVAVLTEGARSGRIAEGFIRAVALCGEVLAEHFPPQASNPNELPDKLIEI